MKNRILSFCAAMLLLSSASAQSGNVGIGTSTPGSTLTVNGSFAAKYNKVTTATYSMAATDYHLAWNGSAAGTVTLPASVSTMQGRTYYIKNATSSQSLTVNPATSETIGGSSSISVPAGQTVQLINNGQTGANPTWEIAGYSNATTSGALPGAANGLSMSGNSIALGGTLASNTNIATGTYNLAFSGTGNVGIGTSNPPSRLSVTSDGAGNGAADDIEISSYNTAPSPSLLFLSSLGSEASPANLTNGAVLGYINFRGRVNGGTATPAAIYSFYTGNGTTNLGNLRFATAGVERMHIGQDGNIGMGTNAPATQLELASSTVDWKSGLLLNNTHSTQGRKFAIASRTDNTSGSGRNGTFTISDETVGSIRLSINQSGYVGIATANPSYPLDVQTSNSVSLSNYGYLNNNSGGVTGYISGSSPSAISIYASGRIAGQEFNAFSDARIKNIEGLSNSVADLDALRKIQITNYTMRDKAEYGNKPFRKVIAQQVEQVYPMAVAKNRGFVPTVYAHALTIKSGADGEYAITMAAAHHLKIGEKVRLIGEDNGRIETEVLAVKGANVFMVKLPKAEARLFVYGPEVTDFRTVDYEAIAMLNVSATQQLAKEIDALKAENKKLAQQAAEFNTLKATVALMQSELEQVVSKKPIASKAVAKRK